MNDEHEKSTRPILKLSLNLPALERLIGGDSEIELNLRHQVASQFAEAKLRNAFEAEMQLLAFDAVKEALKNTNVSALLATHRSELRGQVDLILGEAKAREQKLILDFWNALTDRMDAAVREVSSTMELKLTERIDSRIAHITERITDAVTARVESLVIAAVEKLITERVRKALLGEE